MDAVVVREADFAVVGQVGYPHVSPDLRPLEPHQPLEIVQNYEVAGVMRLLR